MNVLLRPPLLTLEEFENLANHKGYELVDGLLREKGVGAKSSNIQSRLLCRLQLWAEETLLGEAYDAECMYRCFPDKPGTIRKPDVSFVRVDRLPDRDTPDGVFEIRPDFAAEVISPSDTVYDLNEKLADYAAAGIPLVWVVSPNIRTVTIYELGSEPRTVSADGVLSGDPLLPGFSIRVADLFRPAGGPRT